MSSSRLHDIIAGYLDLQFQMDPVSATHAGRHELDGRFGRWDRESVREYAAALRSYTGSLEEVEVDGVEDEIDRTAVLHAARHDLLVLERERPFATNPAFHLGHALNGIFLLVARDGEGPDQRARALLSRLEEIPRLLESAADVLTEPRRVHIETARATLPAALLLVRDGLNEAFLWNGTIDPEVVSAARGKAVAALVAFGDALALMEEGASDRHGIGRELFDAKLRTAHMIRAGADELVRYAERLRDEVRARMAGIADELRPGTDPRELIALLRTDMPSREEALEEYTRAMREAREFTIERDLMTVPPEEPEVVPTPGYLKPLTPFAAYFGPGAFEREQQGSFFVTLAGEGEAWRTFARAEIVSLAVHEGVPGHHQQIVTANRLDRMARRVVATPAAQEGWALYCEELAVEEGLLSSPAERLFQAHFLLWRALRIILDVSLHTRGMSVEEAAAILRDELGFDEPAALSEARRYCAYPTYQLCYAVGRHDILALRDDARAAWGSEFTLRRFHDSLLGYGAYPTALARWGMGLQG